MASLFYMSLRRFSRRFPVISPKAAVVSDEMLASVAGLDVLSSGGNAADAAVAMAACTQVLRPYGSGLGGDCFAMYYDSQEKRVHCVDGSGRSPAALTPELVHFKQHHDGTRQNQNSGLQATVPGAAKAWHHIVTRFGSQKMNFSELLAPAVHYAECGFPLDHMKQTVWAIRQKRLKEMPGGRFFLDRDGQPPKLGHCVVNQPLAQLLKRLAKEGPCAVYEGSVADGIVDALRRAGGVLSTKDLSDHLASTEPLEVQPVTTTFQGQITVHTTPLPTQGAVLLEALNILEGFDLKGLQNVPGQFEHVVIEALRYASADGLRYGGDANTGGSIDAMLSQERARKFGALVKLDRRAEQVCPDIELPQGHSGTNFMAAADETGNVCALIGSLARGFGCAVVEEHGFAIQTRADGFNQIHGHPNCLGPRKKPYHSLMPVIVTDAHTQDWLCTLGAMGGAIQPHVLTQVLLNMLVLGLDPQESVSKSRVFPGTVLGSHPDDSLLLEVGFDQVVRQALEQRGHTVKFDHSERRRYTAGHVNVLARAAQWWKKEETNADGCKLSVGDCPIWCGVETRGNSVALGY